jgi:CheY-like chemotaxis protein
METSRVSALAGRRVLLVEDERLIALLAEDMLTDLGCEVVGPAASLAEARALADREGKLDAALLDVNLRGEPVHPLAEALRARGVAVVLVSGYADPLAGSAAALPVVAKPYLSADLAAALTAALGRS